MPWFVRTAIERPASGTYSTTFRKPRYRPECPSARRPSSGTTRIPSPYPTPARMACVTAASAIIAAWTSGGRTSPRAKAPIQRAASRAVAATEPAPAAAVTTDRNGMTLLGGATGTHRVPPPSFATRRYPVAPSARGFSSAWYHELRRANGSSRRARTSTAIVRPVIASTSSPSSR